MVIGDPVCTAFQQAKYVLMIFIRDIERYGYAFHDASSVIARQQTTAEIAVFRDCSINHDGTDIADVYLGGLRTPAIRLSSMRENDCFLQEDLSHLLLESHK
jgi:hypothetical protein